MTRRGEGKHAGLLNDPDVKRWHSLARQGSLITADVMLRRLGRFCELTGQTPKGIVVFAQNDLKGFQNWLQDCIVKWASEGKSPAYQNGFLKSIRHWLGQNDIDLSKRMRIKGADKALTVEDEATPTQEELRKILSASPLRIRAAVALISQAGFRLQVLGSYEGSDGLRLGDLPDLRIEDMDWNRVPAQVKVRGKLSKTGRPYFTFLSSEGCLIVKEYLAWRLGRGETLTPESPVIGHTTANRNSKTFIRTNRLSDLIRAVLRSVGLKQRPYVLRAYCDTAFDIAEARGFISHPWRQFFMGHKGDIEARYSTNKRLPPDMVEQMRQAYQRCEPFLNSSTVATLTEDARTRLQTLEKELAERDRQVQELELRLSKVEVIERVLAEAEKQYGPWPPKPLPRERPAASRPER